MNKTGFIIIAMAIVGGFVSANGESLLQVASFPKTFNDLSFLNRMKILADGYDELGTVYDSDGKCIAGCAYSGITIEKETDAITRNSQLANYAATMYRDENNVYNAPPRYETTPSNSYYEHVDRDQPQPSYVPTSTPEPVYNCERHRNARQTTVPLNSPLDVDINISSDFGPRNLSVQNASQWHKGIDIPVKTGTPVYATGNGVIEYIRDSGNTGGGKYVVIRHDDTGFRTSYMHLSDNQITRVGDRVNAGCLIGFSGNTGVSSGPHLHYTIYYTQPGAAFGWNSDAVDPVWTTNYFDTNYRFKTQDVKSCLHTQNNFCGTGLIPTYTLPGELR